MAEITASMVKELRERTDAPMMECKRALTEAGGDMVKAEELLRVANAPTGSAVFFANSGTEAIEAAVKLSRRTGRGTIIAAEGAFHGRSTGALALTWKAAYREPFEPLIGRVVHVPFNDEAALPPEAA